MTRVLPSYEYHRSLSVQDQSSVTFYDTNQDSLTAICTSYINIYNIYFSAGFDFIFNKYTKCNLLNEWHLLYSLKIFAFHKV